MFEKFFGKKKEDNKPGIEGVAHVDGSFEEKRFDSVSDVDLLQDNFKDNKVSDRSFHISNRRKEEEGENWSVGVEKYLTKHENSRKPEYKDLHSDWKEKVASGELLAEEPLILEKKEIDEQYLDANAEIAGVEIEDDSDLEQAA